MFYNEKDFLNLGTDIPQKKIKLGTHIYTEIILKLSFTEFICLFIYSFNYLFIDLFFFHSSLLLFSKNL